MDLGRIADIADLLAAAGVIVSLGFLAYELRMNRKLAELSNWRELLAALSDYKGLTHDLEFSDLIERGNRDYSALTPSEQRSYGLYLEQGIHIMGNFLKHNDTMPQKLTGIDGAIHSLLRDLLCHPGGLAWWEQSKPKRRFMPQTYVIVDKVIEAETAKIDTE